MRDGPEISREHCGLSFLEVNQSRKTFQGVVLVDPVVRDLHKVNLLLVQLVVKHLHHLQKPLGKYVLVLIEEDKDVILGLDPPGKHDLVHLLNFLRQLQGLLGSQPSVIRWLIKHAKFCYLPQNPNFLSKIALK